jgi:UDP-N-acetylmuramate dehydrogenase
MSPALQLKELTDLIPDIKTNYDLTDYNTWHLNSTSEYFWEPDDRISFVLQFCSENGIPVNFLGRGSNVLFEKEYTEGLIICTKKAFQELSYEDQFIVAGSGVPLSKIAKFAAEIGVGGFEFLIGIPGNVGGGIMTNAGLMVKEYREIKDVLGIVETIDFDGETKFFFKNEIEFGNRFCNLTKKKLFIRKVYFKSEVYKSVESTKELMLTHLIERKSKQPLTKRTAGSVFKRPLNGKPAGWYIENAGLKGFCTGGAKVSNIHANWIENENYASSEDIKNLINLIKEVVLSKFNVELVEEIHYI